MAEPQKKHRGVKITAGCVAGVAAIAVLAIVGFNAYVRVNCAEFYDKAASRFQIPGLDTGFIPQDIAFSEEHDAWLFSGYIGDGSPSPVWRVNSDGSTSKVSIFEVDGSPYAGHGGGITIAGKFAYITCKGGFMVLNAQDLFQTGENSDAKAIAKVDIGIDPAFINAQNGMLYTGVFYYAGPYDTPEEMHITTPEGTENHAVMYAYKLDDSKDFGVGGLPSAVYSIPDAVQGVAIDGSEQFVFSCSWGIGTSRLEVYSGTGLEPFGNYDVEDSQVDLYFMDGANHVKDVVTPPMIEGIIYHDGSIWLSNESASNKYVFGKLIGGATVYSLPM